MKHIKVGLALGAGAAKGWSHIGVINGLIRLGIRAEVIAGCSAGALVGAAYANRRLGKLEQWVRSFSYWDVLRLMDLSWKRSGLLRGERVFNAVRDLIKADNIEDCALRFGAVATDLSAGRELWLTQGDLRQAIRASCSMPGLLSPVQFAGHWLVDGAIVNPLPVSLARALGADIVIAVDLQQDLHLLQQELMPVQLPVEGTEALKRPTWRDRVRLRSAIDKSQQAPSAMAVMASSLQIMEHRLKSDRLTSDPADILLQPFCPQISTLDFHRAAESIAAGELAVENQKEALLLLLKKQ